MNHATFTKISMVHQESQNHFIKVKRVEGLLPDNFKEVS